MTAHRAPRIGAHPDISSSSSSHSEVQNAANAALWERSDVVATYATGDLRPVEAEIFTRYAGELSGRVLELGCGAGRVTRHLCELADEVHGIDVSPAMVRHTRRALPQATITRHDLRDLSDYRRELFDALVGAFNVLDVLDDADRRRALDGFQRVISPGGLLIFSSHNRAYAPRMLGPAQQPLAHVRARRARSLAGSIVRLPRRIANHRRLRRFERVEPGYSILNDSAHDYSLLHYYVSRDDQERQLAEHGFELVECLDLERRPVERGEQAPSSPELHYVARRA